MSWLGESLCRSTSGHKLSSSRCVRAHEKSERSSSERARMSWLGESLCRSASGHKLSSSRCVRIHQKSERVGRSVHACLGCCGVVWCDVVWRGMVWCGVVWRGVVCGVVSAPASLSAGTDDALTYRTNDFSKTRKIIFREWSFGQYRKIKNSFLCRGSSLVPHLMHLVWEPTVLMCIVVGRALCPLDASCVGTPSW